MTTTVSAPPPTGVPAQRGNLEIRNVSKAFPNVQALTDVSLDIRPGEILAFMGENGAGKSTLLKIINGDYQPDAGTLSLDGREVAFANPRAAHNAGIRVIYQSQRSFPASTSPRTSGSASCRSAWGSWTAVASMRRCGAAWPNTALKAFCP